MRCSEGRKRLGCRARAIIPAGGSFKDIIVTRPHNHAPDLVKQERNRLMHALYKCVQENLSMSSREVYQKVAEA